MKTVLSLVASMLLIASTALAQDCQVKATQPGQGQTVVASQVTTIRVAFSTPMRAGSFSWVSDPTRGAFPAMTGKPVFESPTVAVLPVRLQPGMTYAVGINWGKFNGFRPTANPKSPCEPYMLIFMTSP